MSTDAERLLAAALKTAGLGAGFSPAAVGAKIGLGEAQAKAAARALSNAGVLVLGFDAAAEFSPAYRKAHTRPAKPPARRARRVG